MRAIEINLTKGLVVVTVMLLASGIIVDIIQNI